MAAGAVLLDGANSERARRMDELGLRMLFGTDSGLAGSTFDDPVAALELHEHLGWEHRTPHLRDVEELAARSDGSVAVESRPRSPRGAAAELFDEAERRMGPIDVLVIDDAAVFLASRRARWITGRALQVAVGHAS